MITRGDDKPAHIKANGDKHWLIHGYHSRADGKPHIEFANGDLGWTDARGVVKKLQKKAPL